jgi:hypothetical protein
LKLNCNIRYQDWKLCKQNWTLHKQNYNLR